ncbi:hypothetical protein ACLB2K_063705 [Fragaria x ananassa]
MGDRGGYIWGFWEGEKSTKGKIRVGEGEALYITTVGCWVIIEGLSHSGGAGWNMRGGTVDVVVILGGEAITGDQSGLRDCSVACIFWKHNPLHLKSQSFPGATIAEWIGVVMDRLSGQQLDVFFVSLWALWTERNNILWKGRSCDPFNMSIWALQFLEDYKKVHNKLKVKMKRAKARWSCPPSGRLKLNVDGAFLEDRRLGGIGVVARDEHGVCLVALSRHMPYAQSAMHMEAKALQASLLIAIYRGWNEIEIESDFYT